MEEWGHERSPYVRSGVWHGRSLPSTECCHALVLPAAALACRVRLLPCAPFRPAQSMAPQLLSPSMCEGYDVPHCAARHRLVGCLCITHCNFWGSESMERTACISTQLPVSREGQGSFAKGVMQDVILPSVFQQIRWHACAPGV